MFNSKAALWINGRKNTLSEINVWRQQNQGNVVWIHCASLGEFEQGRPIIEALKREYPNLKIVLTFFSPSGYEIRKKYEYADYVCYLPADTPNNARKFLENLKPKFALVVKYEYWANYFFQCHKQNIPLFIVSGILRKDQRFFGLFSAFWKKVLGCVTYFFVQNEETKKLLSTIGFSNVTISGDSRFDRVIEIAANAKPIHEIEKFKGNSFCVIAGSSWPQEEKMLHVWFEKHKTENIKLILVPHEISDTHISAIQKNFPSSLRWSERNTQNITSAKVLIIDTIGLLSSIYQYADAAVIGGGFGKGIHNVLEAAVWGVPVLFGPNFHKFEEAKQLIFFGGAFVIADEAALNYHLSKLKDNNMRLLAGQSAANYVKDNAGATLRFMEYFSKNTL